MSDATAHTNRLSEASSPYLLQHAHNPVDWWQWSDEAFATAREQDKPIFLSVGYSTCHWCHVMAHESFENEAMAQILNDNFISIKVDREERPDIDSVYMTALQLETGHGGWPLSAFLDHEGRPFFLGTYFPPEDRFGRPGFEAVLMGIVKVWNEQRDEIRTAAEGAITRLETHASGRKSNDIPGEETLKAAFDQLAQRYDPEHGGFTGGNNTKFPTPHVYRFLLRYHHRTNERMALMMTGHSLEMIGHGGIHDHVGGGFHRYSTDQEWHLSHFEKMLYDQAQLAVAYTEAFLLSGDPSFADIVHDVFTYTERDLSDESGGFYCAEDADSEGEEGTFYVWEKHELEQVLGEDDGNFVANLFGFEEGGNFADESTGQRIGKNLMHFNGRALRSTATLRVGGREEYNQRIRPLLDKLLFFREGRARPHLDDKILTSWNGLMIGALAMAGRSLNHPAYVQRARACAEFVTRRMRNGAGDLLRSFRAGVAGARGFLDDYAFLARGLFELYTSTFEIKWLEEAGALCDTILADFQDIEHGGFFFAAEKERKLISTRKEIYDGAEPSGNSVAAEVLIRLGRLLGRSDYLDAAQGVLEAFAEDLKRQPSAHTAAMVALESWHCSGREVVVAIPAGAEVPEELVDLASKWNPSTSFLLRREDEAEPLTKLAAYTKDQHAIDGEATAYVCTNQTCDTPMKLAELSLPKA